MQTRTLVLGVLVLSLSAAPPAFAQDIEQYAAIAFSPSTHAIGTA